MRSLIISAVIVIAVLAYASSWASKLAALVDARQSGVVADASAGPSSVEKAKRALAELRLKVLDAAKPEQRPRSAASPGETVTIYKWRDARGVTHFESRTPSAVVDAEVLALPVNTPARSSRAQTAAARFESGRRAQSSEATSVADAPWSVYLPRGQEALLEQLNETLQRIDSHQRILERISDEL